MIKNILSLCLISLGLVAAGCTGKTDTPGAGDILAVSRTTPVVDGKINNAEYPVMINLSKLKVSFSRSATKLWFAVQSEAMGWVALGFGTSRMNNASMVMGYVKGDSSSVIELKGAGHGHNRQEPGLLLKSALAEDSNGTIFEGEIDAGRIISPDQAVLEFIVACGDDDDFAGYHSYRKGGAVKLK